MRESELADRLALRALADRYARIPDDRDYAAVEQVFAADAVVIGPDFRLEGLEQIRRGMRGIERYVATQHCMGQQSLELAGDEARGEVYCVAYHVLETPDEGRVRIDWGIRYQDLYRREAQGWRIARRELRIVWRQRQRLDD